MAANRLLVVGIGASAGGVEALQAFFAPMPADSGMAFIVVTHIGEGYESALPQILARSTKLPIAPIRNGEAPEPNHIYVQSTDAVPVLQRGRIRVRTRSSRRREHNPIDVFLSSLAEDRGDLAVAVILSGAGHDGTLGAKAIKEKGGLTVAQRSDHTAPRYPEMPGHAISSGAIDLKLPVQEMAAKLVEYSQSLGTLEQRTGGDNGGSRIAEARRAICDILHDEVGHNFSGYKERTFLRRVERRMQVIEIGDIDAYVERLRGDRQEVVQLFQDLLIGVTAFFRDPEAFQALADRVIPKLFEGKDANDTIRVWVPGCATGEEVYSIAILLLEHMTQLRVRPKIVCFATDIDDPAIAIARTARYPAAMLNGTGPERLDRFFIGDGVSYTLTKEVRDLCIFSSHSVIRDPPFSRTDLISCRNLLIYLDKDLQRQLVPVFHYALRPGGYLFLGSSETLTQHSDLFAALDKRNRIFQRRDHAGAPLGLPLPVSDGRQVQLEPRPSARPHRALPLRHLVETRILDQFAPAHIVVTRDGDAVHFSSRTGRYLENAPGAPSRNIFAMARRGLRIDLRSGLTEAVETRRAVRRSGIRVELDERVQVVELTIEPLPDHDVEPLFLIVFCDVGAPVEPDRAPPMAVGDRAASADLERELRDARERLQSMVEEYETALEELKSANEELVSINEELQSTNEELETSREEAQSVNEELNTVNSEQQRRFEELDRANDNLRNLFDGTEIAVMVLDRDLTIRNFTPAVKDIFSVIEIDRGRPLTDIVSELTDFDLRREIKPTLDDGQSRERRIRRRDGKADYLMRVVPYLTAGGAVDGVLLTFTDVTRIAAIEEYQAEARHRIAIALQLVLDVVRRSVAAEAAPETLVKRLAALTETYGLVSQADWGGVALSDLAAQELGNYGIGHDGRVSVAGPPVLLRANGAVAVGMALHELAANAVGHGALSLPQGRVQLGWYIEEATDGREPRLVIRWREADGPRTAAPAAAGYGNGSIETEMGRIGGAANLNFAADGLTAELALPLAACVVLRDGGTADPASER